MQYDVFLSYSRADRERALWFVRALEKRGLSVFWDLEDIPPGETFPQFIKNSLEASKSVVVLWSATSVRSRWVDIEAREGAKRNRLVPVLLDPLTSDDLPFGLQLIHAADLQTWDGRSPHPGLDQLFASIAARIGQEIVPPEPVKPPQPWWRRREIVVAVALALLMLVFFLVIGPRQKAMVLAGPTEVRSTVSSDDGRIAFALETDRRLPSPGTLTEDGRVDFIFFVDIDRDKGTGQSDRGNDYNLHLVFDEAGWHAEAYAVSEAADPFPAEEIEIVVQSGYRAKMLVPAYRLPSLAFSWWLEASALNATPEWKGRLAYTAATPEREFVQAVFNGRWSVGFSFEKNTGRPEEEPHEWLAFTADLVQEGDSVSGELFNPQVTGQLKGTVNGRKLEGQIRLSWDRSWWKSVEIELSRDLRQGEGTAVFQVSGSEETHHYSLRLAREGGALSI